MSKTAKRMLELRIVDAMRDWPAGEPVTVRAIAKALNVPHLVVPDAIQSLRYRGYIELERLALTAWALAANDRGEEADTQAKADDDVVAGGEASPVAAPADNRLTPAQRAVFDVLAVAADAGQPCPKNREIAFAAKVQVSHVYTLLLALEKRGLIIRDQGAALKHRRFQIVATGAWTDWPAADDPIGTGATPTDQIDALRAEEAEIAARIEEKEQVRATRVADLIRQEAEAAAARRKQARSTGTVSNPLPAPAAINGTQIQMHAIRDSAGNVASVLREAWPAYWALLGRLAHACGERPIPLILRLIREEAARKGLRRSRPGDPAWFVPNSGGLDSDFDADATDGQGITIHG